MDSLVIIGGLNNFLKLLLNQEHGEGNVVKDFLRWILSKLELDSMILIFSFIFQILLMSLL